MTVVFGIITLAFGVMTLVFAVLSMLFCIWSLLFGVSLLEEELPVIAVDVGSLVVAILFAPLSFIQSKT
jgi:hypothetical protein